MTDIFPHRPRTLSRGPDGVPGRPYNSRTPCEAHGCEACVTCMIDVYERNREALRASRQEVRRERYEDRVLPWDVGGEA